MRVLRLAAMSTGALVVAVVIVFGVVVGSSFISQHQVTEGVLPSATHTVVQPAAVVRRQHSVPPRRAHAKAPT